MALTQIGMVNNPTLPYTGSIPGGLSPGKQIFIQGVLPMTQEGFALNLQCSAHTYPKVEVALHFNPRFNQGVVVRNSHQKGCWKKEETYGNFPFHPGQPFEIIIAVETSQFKIAVSGQHFTEFQHRMPVHQVNTINISGGVTVFCIRYDAPGPALPASYPQNFPYGQPPMMPQPPFGFGQPQMAPHPHVGFQQTQNSTEILNPSVPYMGDIHGGLAAGKSIDIQGSLPLTQETFVINLQCGRQAYPQLEVALHFNPRFDQGCVVRNSHEGGSWKKEERFGVFPFHPGQPFSVKIVVEVNQYQIHVNGQLFTGFQHRIPFHRVNTLSISGGITISSVRISSSSMATQSSTSLSQETRSIGNYVSVHQPMSAAGSGFGTGMAYPSSGVVAPMQPMYNPPVPFVSGIPGGALPGKMIYVMGNLGSMPSRFNVNLQEGTLDSSDVAFHMDVRFRFGNDVNVVVRNHKSRGTWGSEERGIPFFPFSVGGAFDMIILIEPTCIKVAINNKHFLEFQHRLHPPARYSTLKIDGDIRLTQVRFQ
ncbi:galectin-9-like isoform X1 [Mizuhopecten yessoensis]|uniref:galectin-9-like isoform X1 n=1 Tax=Mizuhopecten yessoensis TaxID=6573 RepID=UPI000B4574A5|nr:galectin-9-like isoform X1 [Mizuhopecten yessoensis]